MPVAEPNECREFLDSHPDIDLIQVFFTNLSGVPRGKNLRRHDLLPIYEHGRYLPGTMFALDITGEDVEASGLVWEDGDADRLGRPVSGTLTPMVWMGKNQAQVMLSVYELDGKPSVYDPRHILAMVIDRFKPLGIVPVIACELEFYLLDPARNPIGAKQPPLSQLAPHYRAQDIQVYGLRELDDITPFLRDLYAACDAQMIPAETAISEYAAGQVEITLRHRNDALRAADDAVMYKRIVKGIATQHGFDATFMAKPFSEHAGSGMHLHVSLADEQGNNLFATEAEEGTPLLRHSIGGMMELLPAAMAIFAPNANSYRRFRANTYAPVAPSWGINNRTVSLRVPAGPASSRHIEHRVCGADANPYLALAAMLAGIHHGITNKIDPGAPVTGNGYAQAADSNLLLPTNWFKAMDLFDQSQLLWDYLDPAFAKVFSAVKRTEQQRFFGQVSELDYNWYFRNA